MDDGGGISASGERSRKWRERMSEEEKEKYKKTDKDSKQTKRASMKEEEKEEKRKKNRENMAKKRAEKKEKENEEKEDKERERKENLYIRNEKKHNREYKKRKASEMSVEEADFVRIEQMFRRKKSRANRTEEEHEVDKEMAKKGMQEFRELGQLKEFKDRDTWYASKTEEEIWRVFFHMSFKHQKVLEDRKPDVADAIKKKKEEEEKRRVKRQREHDEWMQECAPPGFVWRDDDYHWAGEGPQPKETMDPEYWTADLQKMNPEVTEEDERRWKDQEERWLREKIEERKKENNAYMKKYREKKKAKLLEPIEMPDDNGGKSEYLLLQEKNIKEFEERKKMSGLFDD